MVCQLGLWADRPHVVHSGVTCLHRKDMRLSPGQSARDSVATTEPWGALVTTGKCVAARIGCVHGDGRRATWGGPRARICGYMCTCALGDRSSHHPGELWCQDAQRGGKLSLQAPVSFSHWLFPASCVCAPRSSPSLSAPPLPHHRPAACAASCSHLPQMGLLLVPLSVLSGPPSWPPAACWPVLLLHNLFLLALVPLRQPPFPASLPPCPGSLLAGGLRADPRGAVPCTCPQHPAEGPGSPHRWRQLSSLAGVGLSTVCRGPVSSVPHVPHMLPALPWAPEPAFPKVF